MALLFELTGKEEISDMKEFCRRKEELTYVGEFANKETSKVIQGTIIQYDGKFYTTELPRVSGIFFAPAKEKGMVTTTVSLFEAKDYVPEKCKSISDCPILINIWDTKLDDEGPIYSFAFSDDQLAEARNILNIYEDVDIFKGDVKISREDFLMS